MADEISQDKRLMSLKTPAGDDVLCIDRATITERLSKPFVMQFDMIAEASKAESVKYDQLLGNNVTLTVNMPEGKKRFFGGIASRLSTTGQDSRFVYYRMEVVPWLWLLTLSTDCKVFQDKTVPEIIEDVFNEWRGKFSQVVKFENKCTGSFTKLDYCVQYRETDFNFISRLMEQEGIFYYFEHSSENHTLVMSNDSTALPACPEMDKAKYLPASGIGDREDGVLSWEYRHSIVPGKVNLGDYHFQMSNKTMRKSSDSSVKVASNENLEVFDYPGEYAQRFNKPDERMGDVEPHGDDHAKLRMEEQAAGHLVASGTSTCRPFTTGYCFQLIGKDDAPMTLPKPGKYVLTSVKHAIQQSPDYISGGVTRQPYRNAFTCIPQDVPFRAARSSPRPVIQGVQTAVVVGLDKEEIDCDKYGRVKVQFHWDREGQKDEKSSCWVRVATLLGGKQWGMIHIPRIGQEVVVAFLEGDPDHPLIVGSVYNYDNMPPYDLPDNKTQSGLKTRSSKEGTADNFNEIRMEDKKDSEQIYVHAEKNMDTVIENNETRKIGFDKKDKGDQSIEVFNNQSIKVGNAQASDGSQTLEVWKDRTTTIKNGNDTHQVKMGNRDVQIDMGNDTLTIKMGNQTTKLNLGQSSTEALQSIELKVGQSSLKVDQMGVTIKGMMITVEGQIQTQVKGLMTQVQGTAMLQASGGIMMLG